jgi:hypothetical protein
MCLSILFYRVFEQTFLEELAARSALSLADGGMKAGVGSIPYHYARAAQWRSFGDKQEFKRFSRD